jgi:hypothetical protein
MSNPSLSLANASWINTDLAGQKRWNQAELAKQAEDTAHPPPNPKATTRNMFDRSQNLTDVHFPIVMIITINALLLYLDH